MRHVRLLTVLAVLLSLGAGVACKKPKPVEPPKVDNSAEEARLRAEAEARERAAREAAERDRLAREAAERDRLAREAAERDKAEAVRTAYRRAAESALKDINFDFDKDEIREADRAKLQAIAEFMKAYPEAKIRIEGHCDERGTIEYNLALGERRAHAAMAYLMTLGVAETRMSTVSYGKERPKVEGSNEESWLANRRCEFKLL